MAGIGAFQHGQQACIRLANTARLEGFAGLLPSVSSHSCCVAATLACSARRGSFQIQKRSEAHRTSAASGCAFSYSGSTVAHGSIQLAYAEDQLVLRDYDLDVSRITTRFIIWVARISMRGMAATRRRSISRASS